MCCWVRTRLPLDDKWAWPVRSRRAHDDDCVDMRLQPCRTVGLGPFHYATLAGISGEEKQSADIGNRVQVDHKKKKKTTAAVLLIFSLIHDVTKQVPVLTKCLYSIGSIGWRDCLCIVIIQERG